MDSLQATKIAVIGCGFIAETAHLPAYLSAPRVKVVAVADTNEHRLRHISKKFGVENLYTDYHDLLEKESDIDGVSICLPTYLHKDATLQEHIANGFLTELLRVKALAKLLKKPEKKSWYLDSRKGGGALFDTGSHLADLLQWTFGDAKVIASRLSTFPNMPALDAEATVNIAFRNGVEGVLEVSWKSPSEHFYVEVEGSEGKLANLNESALLLQKNNRILGRFTNGFHLMFDQHLSYYWEEIREFVNTLKNGAIRTNLATGEDGLRSLELVASAYSIGLNELA